MFQQDGGQAVGFSPQEFERRQRAVRRVMEESGVDVLVAFGNRAAHHEVLHLTGYAVSGEAVLVFPLGGDPVLLVHYGNHVPYARRVSVVHDVRPRGDDAIDACLRVLREMRIAGPVGVCGPLGFQRHAALAGGLGEQRLVDLGADLYRLRLVKSEEEIAMARVGAQLSDRAIDALLRQVQPGVSEYDLAAIIEAAYLPLGGQTHIHYVGVTSMSEPDLCVPAQFPSSRRVEQGDVIVCELSAHVHGHYGQVLRTIAVGAEPPRPYRRMHEVAEEAFAAVGSAIKPGASSEDVLDAAECIARAGYSILDDLVHCAVGGVYAPYIRTRSTEAQGAAPFEFEENMLIVVQPNVIAADERSGVQYGEMLVVTQDGVQSLHNAPRGFLRCG